MGRFEDSRFEDSRFEDGGAASVVVLSPHLDDAVLGLWHVLAADREVTVATVFAGIPDPGFVTGLDRDHGAVESADWMRRRRTEDRAALALADLEPHHLDLLDIQYVLAGDPEQRALLDREPGRFLAVVRELVDPEARVAAVVEAVSALVRVHPRPCLVYAPLGVGGHPDHLAVAGAALRLAASGHRVRLWADSPYYLRHGLPGQLGGPPNPDADALLRQGIRAHAGHRLTPHLVRLDGAAADRKGEAIRRYRTEYPSLQDDYGPVPLPDLLAHEAWWQVEDTPAGAHAGAPPPVEQGQQSL
ncbi:PIG-L deacetylase family protein [Streptacidiphilus sp. P02-A3a]|uniref:PIG-L deacetylase family protein n=1 Tax=Streptacidiphilus sp. P02-A3a TaxID=2704468 RepID=UPI0015F9BC0E|nr:PIG-L family deacetylase [Streptacidiphilus sp. P02-A3a]QMU68297.1 hypothetical protein GXP74_08715 [Streptacidiphilus sp. P02-A3a]